MQGPRSDFGSKISSTGGKNFSGIALVPTHGTSKVIKKPREVNVRTFPFYVLVETVFIFSLTN